MSIDFGTQSALGGVNYSISKDKFGSTEILGAADVNQAIWRVGGDYTGFPSEVETISLVSTEGADTMNVTIEGLDSDFNEQTETVTMTGVTPVVTTKTWSRAPRFYISSGGMNIGVITANHSTTTANVFGSIQIGMGQSLVGCLTVPNNYTMILKGITIGMARTSGAAGSAVVSLRARKVGETGFRTKKLHTITDSHAWAARYYAGAIYPEKTDIKGFVESISDNLSSFVFDIEYLLIDNGQHD